MYKHCTVISEVGAVADGALQGEQTRLGMSQVHAAPSPMDIDTHSSTLHIQRTSAVYSAPRLLTRLPPTGYATAPLFQRPLHTQQSFGEYTHKQYSLHRNKFVTVLRFTKY